jgi:DNA primase
VRDGSPEVLAGARGQPQVVQGPSHRGLSVYDLDGELALFVARWMGVPPKGGKKVLYPKGSRASHVLFNHQRAAACSTVVITEGVFDAMRVGRSAVCLFGKHASQTQISLLVELGLTRRLVVMLDPDASDDAEALAESLVEVCPDVRIATLPEGRKDPGEATRDEIRRSVRSARSIGVGGQLGSVLAGL